MLHGVRSDDAAGCEQFEPAWRAALAYADAITRRSDAVSDEEFAALSGYWDEGQVVEITLVVGLFNYFNRFNNALRVDITK
jgi:alkylhydroperoxidase family enzyme